MVNNKKQRVSLHLRVWKNLYDTALEAVALERSFFQSFLITQKAKRPLIINRAEQAAFLELRQQNFTLLFAHAAYWINLGSCTEDENLTLLYKEIERARNFAFTHYIVHLGSFKGCKNKDEGISAVARRLNQLMKTTTDIKIVVENTAHAHLSIGTHLEDFATLLSKLEYPDKIGFCLDTAHAYVAGYDITTQDGYDTLMKFMVNSIGLERLSLIHLNDTNDVLASYQDCHEMPGKGLLGTHLARFVKDPLLKSIPLILEIPEASLEEKKEVLALVESWE